MKKAAVDIVRDLTGSEEGLLALTSRASLLLLPLSSLLRSNPPELSVSAVEALINLSQNPTFSQQLLDAGVLRMAMDAVSVVGADRVLVRLLLMLLANLTQADSAATALLQVGEKIQGLFLSKLVRSFCRSSSEETTEDTYEHVASILVNISKLESGRKILLEPKGGLLKQIIRQFDSTNPLRKKGVSGTIRNCCFEADNQLQNLLLISEFLWPALLLPVAGKKVYSQEDTSKMPLELGNALSHEREPVDDPEIRKQALEAIYLIALQKAGRSSLWSVNGTRILQVGYEEEEDPKVMEAYELVGSLLVDSAGAEKP